MAQNSGNGANTSAGNIPETNARQAKKPDPVGATVVKVQNLELLDMQALDPATLDPERHYRWVRTTTDDQPQGISVTRHKLRGYEVETYRDGGPRTLANAAAGEDGTIRMGDLILMSCPKAQRQERAAEVAKRSAEMLASNTATSEEQAKRMGIKLLKGDSET